MAGVPDPIAAMHRANQAFHAQALDTAPLTCGLAHFSTQFGLIGNQVREVTIPAGMTVARAYEEVQAFFRGAGAPCRRWTPALGQPTEELEAFLATRGFVPKRRTVMALRPWPELPPHPRVRIVPGRAVRQALRELLLSDEGLGRTDRRELVAQMVLSRMDDPGFDMLLALVDGQPAGQGALLQAGPIAAIYDVFVRKEHRRQGVGLAIVADLVTLCRRLELRTVVLDVDEENAAAIGLYERCGFVRAGSSVEFVRAAREGEGLGRSTAE
ncbi:MAG: GNAT family N-acetyltransferase [Planctomycetes bacterium]|nr:GNAT family N-acetyltransferase [Planctomycetota bacterium]